jgi:hypothetical protein
LRLQAVNHLGDLRDRDKVELATECDQGRATLRTSLHDQMLSPVELGGRRSGGFR